MKIDKYRHVLAGMGIFSFCLMIFGFSPLQFLLSFSITAFIAIAWEIYQHRSGKGVGDIYDVIATIAIPGITTFIVLLISFFIIFE